MSRGEADGRGVIASISKNEEDISPGKPIKVYKSPRMLKYKISAKIVAQLVGH